MAQVLDIPHDLTSSMISAAQACIHASGVLAVATESAYALAAGVEHPQAIERIIQMKGDRRGKPILLLVSSRAQVLRVAPRIPSAARALMDRFWPGPLTLILPAAEGLPEALTGGTGTIGVRQPGRQQLLQLLDATGPLTGTSANRSGGSAATSCDEIIREFGQEIDLILDSGPSPGGKSSTLVQVTNQIRLLRRGPISIDAVQETLTSLGLTVQDSTC